MRRNNDSNLINILQRLFVFSGLLGFVCLGFSTDLKADPNQSAMIKVAKSPYFQAPLTGRFKGEVLVKFRKEAPSPRVWVKGPDDPVLTERIFKKISKRRDRVYLHATSNTFNTIELLDIYRSDPLVESVSPNYARSLHRLPDDPYFDQLWGLRNTGQTVENVSGEPGADIEADPAWDTSTGDADVVIAVIDSGAQYYHEDLAGNMWQNTGEVPGNGLDDDGNGYVDDVYGYDFAVDESGNNYSDPIDIETHGSHVSGTAAAVGNNGIGITGVAWNVKIMALKGMRPDGFLYDSDVIEAIEYAIAMKARGVNVVAINASFGTIDGSQNDPMSDVIEDAGQAGIVFVASAGNDGVDNDQDPHYPSSYDAFNIISVSASNQFDVLAGFSNYGSNSVDLAAPGESIFSTVPEAESSLTSGVTEYPANTFQYAGHTSGITGTGYDCGKGYPEDFPEDVSGNIALIERGSDDENPFYFSDKVQNAMDKGAAAVIIYNHEAGLVPVTLGTPGDWVPAVFISQADGKYLAGLGTPSATVVNQFVSRYEYSDGTSMACPHVTGAVAVLAAAFPRESVSRRINRIFKGAEVLATLSGKVSTGGRLNLYNALRV
jgi:subtilisin family serine protease